ARKRANRLDRAHLDSVMAEKVGEIISELKSTSRRPVWITKCGMLRRAGCLSKYSNLSTDVCTAFPTTEALLRENAETRGDYLTRKIRWVIAEMAAHGQTISTHILSRKAGVPWSLMKEYKQLVLETAQQLGANVDPRSFFARDT